LEPFESARLGLVGAGAVSRCERLVSCHGGWGSGSSRYRASRFRRGLTGWRSGCERGRAGSSARWE
jgi:hypothetical protein